MIKPMKIRTHVELATVITLSYAHPRIYPLENLTHENLTREIL